MKDVAALALFLAGVAAVALGQRLLSRVERYVHEVPR